MPTIPTDLSVVTNFNYMVILTFLGKYALKFVVSVLIFVIGKWIIDKLMVVLTKVLSKSKMDNMLVSFLKNAVKTMLLIFVIVAALSNLGIETTSFVAILGAMGLAIGMAFKDTFGNIGAGVLIIFFRPFKIGDFIEAGGTSGNVRELNLFSTYILTTDNKTVIIPNSQIIGSTIINYSLQEFRRVDLVFSIDYGDSIKKAKDIIISAASTNQLIIHNIPDKQPFVGVLTLGDSSVDIAARFWVKTENYWQVFFEMQEKIKIAFDENGISIPFPQVVNHFSELSNVPKLVSNNTL